MMRKWASRYPSRFVSLALLAALGLGCGGSDRAASSRPPTPPPFRPQTVEVRSSTNQGILVTTLMTREGGGYNRNGREFRSGTEVEVDNRRYELTLGSNGRWSAEFVPQERTVRLGNLGGSITLMTTEAGGYERNDQPFASGDTVTANNRRYELTLGSNGRWSAEFVPQERTVRLGNLGGSITLMTTEAGGYERNNQPFASGSTVTVNGNDYQLTLNSGRWSAQLVVRVRLGESGSQAVLFRTEDGRYHLGADWGPLIESGNLVSASNGQPYRLELRNGAWTAEFAAEPVEASVPETGETLILEPQEDGSHRYRGRTVRSGFPVEAPNGNRYTLRRLETGAWEAVLDSGTVSFHLGSSGSTVALTKRADGSWVRADRPGVPFRSEDTVTASNGGRYRLALRNGMWRAEYIPTTTVVPTGERRPGIILIRLEDGTYWHDRSDAIVQDGTRVTSDGAVYELQFRGGEWSAALRSEPPTAPVAPVAPRPTTADRLGASAYVGSSGVSVEPALKADADRNPRTVLEVGGADYSVARLFSDLGVREEKTFAEAARDGLRTHLERFRLIVALGEDTSGYRSLLTDRWRLARNELEALVGSADADRVLGDLPTRRNGTVDTDEAEEVLEDVLAALASLSSFESALDGGIFDEVRSIDSDDADQAFYALRRRTRLLFEATANTRYGAYARAERDSLARALTRLDGDEGRGVFAYSPLPVSRITDLSGRGEAVFRGETIAMTGADNPEFYTGDIEVRARFSTRRVSALVTDLSNEGGAAWKYLSTDVESIYLPPISFGSGQTDATFEASGDATVAFGGPGALFYRPVSVSSAVEGRFLGRGTQSGSAVIGGWRLGSSESSPELTGAFGAEYRSSTGVSVPVIDDAGAGAASFIEARPDRSGNIPLGGNDAGGSQIEFRARDLFVAGGAAQTGQRLFSLAEAKIKRQLDVVIDSAIALDDARIREQAWDSVNQALQDHVFGSRASATDLLGRDYPKRGSRFDDGQARETVRDVLAALASPAAFEAALERGEVFYDVRGVVDDADPEVVFATREYDLEVQFDSTNHTRFGVWAKRVGNTAVAGYEAANREQNVFAYSPLTQTEYGANDPGFPRDVTATYSGTTLAVDFRRSEPAFFEGDVQVEVAWQSTPGAADVRLLVRDLRAVDGGYPFRHDGYDVERILFDRVATNGRAGTPIEFDSNGSSPSVSIRYRDSAFREATWSGNRSHSGKFVGRSFDGPLGVIGTWSLEDAGDGIDIQGSYGADLGP